LHNVPNPKTGFGTTLTVPPGELKLLYRAGGFEGNFLRGMLLIAAQMMFVAALSILAASFASFPVACLLSFGLLPFALAGEFVQKALSFSVTPSEQAAIRTVGHYVMNGMHWVLPNLTAMSPAPRLAGGLYISWPEFSQLAGMTVFAHTLILLLLACWVFTKRELARVQA
jgi:hypothetical protein